jgi:hypothetical protein
MLRGSLSGGSVVDFNLHFQINYVYSKMYIESCARILMCISAYSNFSRVVFPWILLSYWIFSILYLGFRVVFPFLVGVDI